MSRNSNCLYKKIKQMKNQIYQINFSIQREESDNSATTKKRK
jgi:hypothetical protein